MHNTQNNDLQGCITLCWECRTECQKTLFHDCLEQGGKHVEASHVSLMTDCIQACQTAADFMVRGSSLHAAECAICAEVCDACAESCERIGSVEMKRCADVCRRCAQSCRDMGKMRKAA